MHVEDGKTLWVCLHGIHAQTASTETYSVSCMAPEEDWTQHAAKGRAACVHLEGKCLHSFQQPVAAVLCNSLS